MEINAVEFERIAGLSESGLVSEEDVKNKVVLPMLRAFGYGDSEFNYERRTGRGYVDVVVEGLPVGIVVETKSPRTRLDDYVDQLESYVFHKHTHDRSATIAILTDGNQFRIYGVTDDLRKGALPKHEICSFRREQLGDPSFVDRLLPLLAREQNQAGAVPGVILTWQKEMTAKQKQLCDLDTELQTLKTERARIDAQINDLQAKRESIMGPTVTIHSPGLRYPMPHERSNSPWGYSASPHILRILEELGARSRSKAIERQLLDQKLIEKVDGVKTVGSGKDGS